METMQQPKDSVFKMMTMAGLALTVTCVAFTMNHLEKFLAHRVEVGRKLAELSVQPMTEEMRARRAYLELERETVYGASELYATWAGVGIGLGVLTWWMKVQFNIDSIMVSQAGKARRGARHTQAHISLRDKLQEREAARGPTW